MNMAMQTREKNEYNSIGQVIQGKTLVLDDEDVAELQKGMDRIQNAHERLQALITALTAAQAAMRQAQRLAKERDSARSKLAAAERKLEAQRAAYEKALVNVRTEERAHRERLTVALEACQRMLCICQSD